jgi:hypothetical protein
MMMEKTNRMKILIIAGIVIAIALFSLSYSIINPSQKFEINSTTYPNTTSEINSNEVAGGLSHNIVLQKNLPGNTDHIMTYKMVHPHYTREDIISLAQKFNISEPYLIKGSDEGFSIGSSDGNTHVLMLNTGWIEYWNSHRHSVNSLDVPGNLPSDEEAVKIATAFLKRRNLLPEDAEVRRIDHVKTYNLGDSGQKTVVWEDIEVWYGRKLDGYPVEGTKLMLAIGAHGDPIEFLSNWREYKPYQEMPVKTAEKAFEDLKTNGVSVGMHLPEKVSISDMYLAYRTKAGSDTEEYLEPVWMFKGNITDNDNSIEPVDAYIPALTDESATSLSSK